MTRKARRAIVIAAGAVVALAAVFVLDTLYVAGSFKRLSPHGNGACKPVAIAGVEDMALLDEGHAFLSSDDRRARQAGRPTPGAIWLYDVSGATAPRNLTPAATTTFHPHGIGYWSIGPGRGRLFVVNHPGRAMVKGAHRHAIEIFDWQEGELVHAATVTDAALFSPNDVVAVGADRFYVTNDHGSDGFARTLENWLRLERANVVYHDGTALRTAAEGIATANGIEVSADGRTLYVASTTGRALLVYDRDARTGVLSNRREIALGTAPDNIVRGADGHLWVAAHPKLLRYVDHVKDAAALSPSQVLEVAPGADGSAVTEVFLDDGAQLSGSSVALRTGASLLVGPVFADHFLNCAVP